MLVQKLPLDAMLIGIAIGAGCSIHKELSVEKAYNRTVANQKGLSRYYQQSTSYVSLFLNTIFILATTILCMPSNIANKKLSAFSFALGSCALGLSIARRLDRINNTTTKMQELVQTAESSSKKMEDG
ncbi:MAG: hypothetical protein SP4CHLAM5_10650 [Chlamydiia bacterium]|nr:hypothetical protein [Chlamydiia bacterium]MCH9618922.1 hypothetical protein [Chlamydiia bacterium]MCH9624635.1 hypothetical protein [Chlamydiia bacterium]